MARRRNAAARYLLRDVMATPRRTRLGVLALVALLHVVAILGLIRAFAPDFTAQAVDKVLSTFTVTITAPPPPPPPPPAPEPKAAGAEGAAGKKAVPSAAKAPQPKIPIAKAPAPIASSTGSAVTSGATSQGNGTAPGPAVRERVRAVRAADRVAAAPARRPYLWPDQQRPRLSRARGRARGEDRQVGHPGADCRPVGPRHGLPHLSLQRLSRNRCQGLQPGCRAPALQACDQCCRGAGDVHLLLAAEVLFLTRPITAAALCAASKCHSPRRGRGRSVRPAWPDPAWHRG